MRKGKLLCLVKILEAECMSYLMEEMEKHGYNQYEISNFAKPGYESHT